MDINMLPSDPPYRTSNPPALEEEEDPMQEKAVDEEEEPSFPIFWVFAIVVAIELGVFFFLPLKETIVISSVINIVGFATYRIKRFQARYQKWTEEKKQLEKEKGSFDTISVRAICNTLFYESKNTDEIATRFCRANSHITKTVADEIADWARRKRA